MFITTEFARTQFSCFNQICFGGTLPDIPIVLSSAKGYLGKLCFRRTYRLFRKAVNSDFKIRFSKSFDLPEEEWKDIILHEMMHLYIVFNNLQDSSPHGRLFREMMRSFNARYGRHVTISHKTKNFVR